MDAVARRRSFAPRFGGRARRAAPRAVRHQPRHAARGDQSGRVWASVGGWTLVSRVTGFARLLAVGAVLGPTFLGNLFQTANQLPNLAFDLVAGQLIASLLIPALVGHLDAGDRRRSEQLVGGFLGVIAVLFSAVALIITAAGPLVVTLLGAGIDSASIRHDLLHKGVPLIAVVMPQLVLYGLIGVANAVQNARHRFGLAAAAPVIENVLVIAAVIVFRVRAGTAVEIDTVGWRELMLLGSGSTVAVAAHAALQWWGAARVGVVVRPRTGWRDPEVRRITRLAVPSLLLAGLTAGQSFACIMVAGRVAGGVVAFQLGIAVVATVVAVGARPFAVAALPDLARHAGAGRRDLYQKRWNRSIQTIVALLVPAAAALMALGRVLAPLAGLGRMSTPAAVSLLGAAVIWLGLATVGDGVASFATQAAFARRDGTSPLIAAVLRTATVAAGLALATSAERPATVVAIVAGTYSAGALVAAGYLYRATVRRVARTSRNTIRFALCAANSVAAALCARTAVKAIGLHGGPLGRVATAAGAAMVFVTVCLAATALTMSRRRSRPRHTARTNRTDRTDRAAP